MFSLQWSRSHENVTYCIPAVLENLALLHKVWGIGVTKLLTEAIPIHTLLNIDP